MKIGDEKKSLDLSVPSFWVKKVKLEKYKQKGMLLDGFLVLFYSNFEFG